MKKKKGIKVVLIIVVCILCGIGVALYLLPISFYRNQPKMLEQLPNDTLLTAEQVAEDREQMIQFVEDVHPMFIDGSDISVYEQKKQNYIENTGEAMTVGNYQVATSEYLSAFEDGHTRLWWSDDAYLEIYHEYHEGNMYVSGTDQSFDQYVTAIDDVPVENIFETIDKMIPAENEMGKLINYDQFFNAKVVLENAGLQMDKEEFTIYLNDGNHYTCGYMNRSAETVEEEAREEVQEETQEELTFWDGDVFVVRFQSCSYGKEFDQIKAELEKAVNNGCKKVIIDIRDNGGGNSDTCVELLKTMNMSAPSYGMLVRYSKEAKEQVGYLRSHGKIQMTGSQSAKQNDDIKLVVLCNRYTFSSATMMCGYVRDAKLGTLIGEPSSNKPSAYGDILYISLKNSHLFGSVSHKKFERPDRKNQENMFVPDVRTTNSEAYGAAIAYLRD